jgi:ribosome-associated protein
MKRRNAAVQELAFALETEYVELNQLLKLVGLCDSGGAGKVLVAEGLVRVDGVIETRKTAKIRAGQVVVCGDVRVTVSAG